MLVSQHNSVSILPGLRIVRACQPAEVHGIDEHIVVVSWHLHVGCVQAVVGLDVTLVLDEGVFACLDDPRVLFELEVGHGQVGVGHLVIGVLVLHVLLVLFHLSIRFSTLYH